MGAALSVPVPIGNSFGKVRFLSLGDQARAKFTKFTLGALNG